MLSEFTLREAPTALCAQCGLPVRVVGKSDDVVLCTPSCRVARMIFGAPHGPSGQYVRLVVGAWAVGVSGLCIAGLNYFEVGPDSAVPVLWAQAALFVIAFFALGLPQWQGPSDEHPGLRHESVVVLACVAVALHGVWRLAKDFPVSLFQPTLVMALIALGNWLDLEIRRQGARSLGSLLDAPPKSVATAPGESAKKTAVAELRAGDKFMVQPGESVALEASLIVGKGLFSTLRVSGSSEPLMGGPGLVLPAGAVNLGQAVTVQATRNGSAASWARVHRGIHDLVVAGRDHGTGVAGLFTHGDLVLMLLASAVLFWLLWNGHGSQEALNRFLTVLAAGGAGAYLAARDLAVALTAKHLARAGVAARSLEALEDTSEAPIGGEDLLPAKGGPLRFLRDSGVDPMQWQETVLSCRKLMYNIHSSPWILFFWTSAGIALAAVGLLLPGMAAGFALLGSVIHTHRALKLSKNPEARIKRTLSL